MAPSLDFGVSNLLCAEEDIAIFSDDFCYEEFEDSWVNTSNKRINPKSTSCVEFLSGDLALQSDEYVDLMIKTETEHLPATDYLKRLRNGDLDLGARMEAIDWITKVHTHFNFGPLSLCLSINYLDRFLSAYQLPKGNSWMMHLLAIACLSLAAKMDETEVPLSLDLQVGDSKFIFESKTIRRMELGVLSTLKWRMQAITPFSFLDYFLRKINVNGGCLGSVISESTQLISSVSKRIEILEFKPSEIAAAVAISVVEETENAISALVQFVPKERVLMCMELIKVLDWSGSGLGLGSGLSPPESPMGVLEAAACLSLSYTSDDIVESCANTSTPHFTKRRKLNQVHF